VSNTVNTYLRQYHLYIPHNKQFNQNNIQKQSNYSKRNTDGGGTVPLIGLRSLCLSLLAQRPAKAVTCPFRRSS